MREEAGMAKQNRVFVQRPSEAWQSLPEVKNVKVVEKDKKGGGAWLVLGDRLHLEQDDIDDLVVAQRERGSTFEMPFSAALGSSIKTGSGDLLVQPPTYERDVSVELCVSGGLPERKSLM
jgi:hypothetical protein